VSVVPGKPTNVTDKLDASGTVVTVKDKRPEEPDLVIPAEPTYETVSRPLAYSDEAFEHDVWGLAWLLLDVDSAGRVVAMKFYKRPGHGLDEIAIREAWTLRFKPARDAAGHPMGSKVLWKMEWEPLSLKAGGLENNPHVNEMKPCAGSGRPWDLGSFFPMYRDCSAPDYELGAREPWIRPPSRGATRASGPAPNSDDEKLKEGAADRYRADLKRTLENACAVNDVIGCYNLALKVQADDPRRAAALYQRACDGHLALACSNLGLMYQHGAGLLKDATHAGVLFDRSCAAGEPIGCTNLGNLYMNGTDVRRDPARARAALEKACDASEAVGCYDLSIVVDWGIGGKYDPERAAALRAKACKGGYAKACQVKAAGN
jgi:hypothetical protein